MVLSGGPRDIHLTYASLAVGTAGGATDARTAFKKTWDQFSTGSGPANVTTWDSRNLYYYYDGYGFKDCARNAGALLDSTLFDGSGQCGSFAFLLQAALEMNGIPSEFVSIRPEVGVVPLPTGEVFLVKNWTPQPGKSNPYKLQLNASDGFPGGMVPAPVNRVFGDLKSENGLAGQGTAPPSEKVFSAHFIVKVDATIAPLGQGCYFDPSYGANYATCDKATGAADFESKSIWGYAVPQAPANILSAYPKVPGDPVRVSFNK